MEVINENDLAKMSPKEFRTLVARGKWTGTSINAAHGYTQANLVVVPQDWAFDFLLFCVRNPRACPLIEVTEPGSPNPSLVAREADLRTDLPLYRIWVNGALQKEASDVTEYWREDLIAFLFGCSFTFDQLLRDANISYQLLGAYISNICCVPAGRLKGKKMVSARLFSNSSHAVRAIQVTSRYPALHGPPIHIGDPSVIGIKDIYHPDVVAPGHKGGFTIKQSDLLLYWECGITPQQVAVESKVPFMITHSVGGGLFVTDLLCSELALL
jgi:uncharacterized protein YcsI (UPF0317 family)